MGLRVDNKSQIILSGIVGSHAYNLNNDQSDIDLLGVFAYHTPDMWRLNKLSETNVHTKPDTCYHEIEKFLRLCLNCNPTVMELLWLPAELYIYVSREFPLLDLRLSFLSTDRVRKAYGGYAYAQIKKVIHSDNPQRFKYARHCFRLLRQGKSLLETGTLILKCDREEYARFELMPLEEMEALFEKEYAEFKAIDSVLPEKPDEEGVNYFLYETRKLML